MTKVKELNRDELAELLRYFLGNPPYIQDARFRELRDIFNATDERTDNADVRYNVDYERKRIDDAEDERGSVEQTAGTVQGGKLVKPEQTTLEQPESKTIKADDKDSSKK